MLFKWFILLTSLNVLFSMKIADRKTSYKERSEENSLNLDSDDDEYMNKSEIFNTGNRSVYVPYKLIDFLKSTGIKLPIMVRFKEGNQFYPSEEQIEDDVRYIGALEDIKSSLNNLNNKLLFLFNLNRKYNTLIRMPMAKTTISTSDNKKHTPSKTLNDSTLESNESIYERSMIKRVINHSNHIEKLTLDAFDQSDNLLFMNSLRKELKFIQNSLEKLFNIPNHRINDSRKEAKEEELNKRIQSMFSLLTIMIKEDIIVKIKDSYLKFKDIFLKTNLTIKDLLTMTTYQKTYYDSQNGDFYLKSSEIENLTILLDEKPQKNKFLFETKNFEGKRIYLKTVLL